MVALQPPDRGFSGADHLHLVPNLLMGLVVEPLTKKFGVAMAAHMGTQSALFTSISQPHPANVDITSIRAVGDRVSSADDEASAKRKAKILSVADHVMTLAGEHIAAYDPSIYKGQGLASPYSKLSQTTSLAATALLHAQSLGLSTEESFPGVALAPNPFASATLLTSESDGLASIAAKLSSRRSAPQTPPPPPAPPAPGMSL